MKIFVVDRSFIRKQYYKDKTFFYNNNVINIRDHDDNYPLINNKSTVLRLIFDDVTDIDRNNEESFRYIFFDENHAKQILDFINQMDKSKDLYVNCFAGISRSGAVGDCLNQYFNIYLENNEIDKVFFKTQNWQIQPNSLVKRILSNTLFGKYEESSAFLNINLSKYKHIFIKEN